MAHHGTMSDGEPQVGTEIEVPPTALLKVQLATGYFVDGQSKVELASRHGLSRFQVARLLDEARDEGIVRIQIVDPTATGHNHAQLAAAPRDLLGDHCQSAPGRVDARRDRPAGGAAAADGLLSEGGRLGVAWSRTLMHLPDSLEALPAADVVQLVGPAQHPRLLHRAVLGARPHPRRPHRWSHLGAAHPVDRGLRPGRILAALHAGGAHRPRRGRLAGRRSRLDRCLGCRCVDTVGAPRC